MGRGAALIAVKQFRKIASVAEATFVGDLCDGKPRFPQQRHGPFQPEKGQVVVGAAAHVFFEELAAAAAANAAGSGDLIQRKTLPIVGPNEFQHLLLDQAAAVRNRQFPGFQQAVQALPEGEQLPDDQQLLSLNVVPEKLMRIFTNEPELIALGGEYIKIAALSYLLTGITQCYLCVMKTTGMTKQSSVISSFALGLDTVLNAVFIFGLRMGAAGAALTITISRFVELGIVLAYSGKLAAKPHFGRISRALHRDFLKCSIPHLINSLVWGLGTSLYSVIIGHLGTAITAANSVANIVRQLAIFVCRGLGSGGEIMLANVLGSGDLVKGREYGRRLSRLSVLCGVVCAVLALIFGGVLSHFMTLSDAARADLNVMILICAFYMLAQCINVVVVCGVFSAGGDTAFDAYSVAVTMWLIILPLAAAAAFWWKWEPLIVYFILSLDEIVKIPWVYAHYKKYKWLKNITKEEPL